MIEDSVKSSLLEGNQRKYMGVFQDPSYDVKVGTLRLCIIMHHAGEKPTAEVSQKLRKAKILVHP